MVIRWENGGPGRLLACGVDAEQVSRFAKLVGDPRPWPQIFSAREAAHAAGLGDPAAGLCASFCCKEALVKALESAFPYPECELLYQPGREEQELILSAGIRERHHITQARARLLAPREGELAAVVSLYGERHG
jgi:phosphopantetheinyl transferase (holo-ACP synthase)